MSSVSVTEEIRDTVVCQTESDLQREEEDEGQKEVLCSQREARQVFCH